MLTVHDDLLWHQTADTFDHATTSDPRFYDRHWFAIYNPSGDGAIQMTMGAYKNMNVLDAGCVVVRGDKQYNVRASRSLRPVFETTCSPLSIETVEPLSAFDIVVADGPHDIHGELHWRAVMPPEEEARHFGRIRGRITEDYCRFNQVGVCNGRLVVGGEEVLVEDWWACRDHSWGVRPRMGVKEPTTGPTQQLDEEGFLMAFLFFSTVQVAGHVQVMERGTSRYYQSGLLTHRGPDGRLIEAESVTVEMDLVPGTRRFRSVVLSVVADGGEQITFECEARGPAVVMRGLGYSGGWRDRLGLGAWRGEHVVEHETWGVGHPADVVDETGKVHRPWHRLQPVHVRVTSATDPHFDSEGFGSITMLPSGRLENYGLLD